MLFLSQMSDTFNSGVAWYGFPYRGADNQSRPVDFLDQLESPMLIIHGTHDQPSPISEIYNYTTELNASDKYFELKVYQGEPHGFMIDDGQLSQSSPGQGCLLADDELLQQDSEEIVDCRADAYLIASVFFFF